MYIIYPQIRGAERRSCFTLFQKVYRIYPESPFKKRSGGPRLLENHLPAPVPAELYTWIYRKLPNADFPSAGF